MRAKSSERKMSYGSNTSHIDILVKETQRKAGFYDNCEHFNAYISDCISELRLNHAVFAYYQYQVDTLRQYFKDLVVREIERGIFEVNRK